MKSKPALAALAALVASLSVAAAAFAQDAPIVFQTNAGWCWYQDERVLVDGDKVVLASVAGTNRDGAEGGDIRVTARNLDGTGGQQFELHDRLHLDDHAEPALLRLPDGRYLAMYSKHSHDALARWRITTSPGDVSDWTPEQSLEHSERVCYTNLFRLSAENGGEGRLYNFTRSVGADPNVMLSDDEGNTWRGGTRLLDWPDRPYLKYAGNGTDTIHFTTTDGHPRVFDNSIYHGFIRDGKVHDSAGKVVDTLDADGLKEKTLTKVFQGDPQNVAWTVDMHLDAEGHPMVVFSVQKDGAAIKNNPGEGRAWDHRYHYARWDGKQWHVHEMAFAGTGLYAVEPDYTGLAAIDPQALDTVFISADVDPRTGLPNVSKADKKRHYEIFKGVTPDGGKTWEWTAVTRDSTVDNLRPVIPSSEGGPRVVLWMRGAFRTYVDYDTDIVGIVADRD